MWFIALFLGTEERYNVKRSRGRTGAGGYEKDGRMKITLQKTDAGQEEAIIRYHNMTPEISEAVRLLSGGGDRLAGTDEEGRVRHFILGEVFYFESVDGAVYAYLERETCRMREKLEELLCRYGGQGMVRCTRTMAVNLYQVEWLKSQPGGKILAELANGERVLISRKYAQALRERLRRGRREAE